MDDLISRQSAIDALRDAENHAFNSFYQGLLKAHKIIADLPSAQTEQRWIPCGERLPKKGTLVVITNDKGNVRCGQYRGLWYSNGGNVNKWVFRGNVIETVLAWMPLPNAYEAEK